MIRCVLPAAILAAALIFPRVVVAAPAPDTWRQEVTKMDEIYWAAFNRGDADAVNAFLTDDVEFYHDLGGMLIGKKALAEVNNGMKTATERTRREAIPGTVRMYPLRHDDKVYGAIVTGEHRFFVAPKGKPEKLVGRSIFSHLLLLKDKKWMLARVYSYEHQAVGK